MLIAAFDQLCPLLLSKLHTANHSTPSVATCTGDVPAIRCKVVATWSPPALRHNSCWAAGCSTQEKESDTKSTVNKHQVTHLTTRLDVLVTCILARCWGFWHVHVVFCSNDHRHVLSSAYIASRCTRVGHRDTSLDSKSLPVCLLRSENRRPDS